MHNPRSPAQSPLDWTQPGAAGTEPSLDSEITWLLHRAAQRMRGATGEQAERQGVQLRDYIVLSALHKTPNLTQIELGKALGLDKTTLMSQLDRLERRGLVVRRTDPRDRRARIPEITEAGNALRGKVAGACDSVEATTMNSFSQDQVQTFRRMLFEIIGDVEDRGSCL